MRDMELKLKFNDQEDPSPPMTISSYVELNYLFEMNNRHATPICLTLVRKDVVKGEQVDSDGGDHNANDFLNTV